MNGLKGSFPQPEKSNLDLYDPTPSFQTQFASLSLHQTDRIRLLHFSAHDVASVRETIKIHWPFGIQNERLYSGSHEFKCSGNPWNGQGSDSIPARILMCHILARLFELGWILTASTDISKKQHDKDTLIFRKQSAPPPCSTWIAISFNQGDRLRLIGASPELVVAFRSLLKNMKLLQSEAWKDQRLNAWEFKINGYPWMPSGGETMSTRLLVLGMLQTLEGLGWSLYASVDQNNGSDKTSETDSWYCVRARDWTAGDPILHR